LRSFHRDGETVRAKVTEAGAEEIKVLLKDLVLIVKLDAMVAGVKG
jgi:hypothetical protein